MYSIVTLIRGSPRRPPALAPQDVQRVRDIVASCPDVYANLALLGDKSFLFGASGRSFLMYSVHGRSWIAMGDPVGPAADWPDLIWRFRELSDRQDGWTVFYEVAPERLPLYLEVGLSPLKIGEEARVALEGFSIDRPERRNLRRSHRSAASQGCQFQVLESAAVQALLPEFKAISDRWMSQKHTSEKGFSLGWFDEDYLVQFPAAVVRRDNRIVAFANLWQGAEHGELSVDLMRYDPDQLHGIMDYLFVELMQWGSQQGYRWFNLGMAPLAGLEDRPLGPLWNRIGGTVFRLGEHFYNFQGLRRYKEKFDPLWRPKYLLAKVGLLLLPRVLLDLAGLISSGPKGVTDR
jgi:phosphatidylglycerol lysyltransferase